MRNVNNFLRFMIFSIISSFRWRFYKLNRLDFNGLVQLIIDWISMKSLINFLRKKRIHLWEISQWHSLIEMFDPFTLSRNLYLIIWWDPHPFIIKKNLSSLKKQSQRLPLKHFICFLMFLRFKNHHLIHISQIPFKHSSKGL